MTGRWASGSPAARACRRTRGVGRRRQSSRQGPPGPGLWAEAGTMAKAGAPSPSLGRASGLHSPPAGCSRRAWLQDLAQQTQQRHGQLRRWRPSRVGPAWQRDGLASTTQQTAAALRACAAARAMPLVASLPPSRRSSGWRRRHGRRWRSPQPSHAPAPLQQHPARRGPSPVPATARAGVAAEGQAGHATGLSQGRLFCFHQQACQFRRIVHQDGDRYFLIRF